MAISEVKNHRRQSDGGGAGQQAGNAALPPAPANLPTSSEDSALISCDCTGTSLSGQHGVPLAACPHKHKFRPGQPLSARAASSTALGNPCLLKGNSCLLLNDSIPALCPREPASASRVGHHPGALAPHCPAMSPRPHSSYARLGPGPVVRSLLRDWGLSRGHKLAPRSQRPPRPTLAGCPGARPRLMLPRGQGSYPPRAFCRARVSLWQSLLPLPGSWGRCRTCGPPHVGQCQIPGEMMCHPQK